MKGHNGLPVETKLVYRCDRCSNEGALYTVEYPDGTKTFVLCDRHNVQLTKLKEADFGEWKPKRTRRKFEKKEL